MEDKLIRLTTFSSPVEAEYFCSVLKEAGIVAFVDGASTGTILSHVGTALGGVKLMVTEKEFPIARQIFLDTQSKEEGKKEWVCLRCVEHNEGNFDFCWNCEANRSGNEKTAFSDSKRAESAENNPSKEESDPEIDQKLRSAFRSAIFGVFLLPVLFNFYSAYLLMTVGVGKKMTKAQDNSWYTTLLINFGSFLLWFSMLRLVFG